MPARRAISSIVSMSCAPRTTTISSTAGLRRTRSSTGSSSAACFGDPKRVDAPAARTTAAIMQARLWRDCHAAHDDPPRRLLRGWVAEPADLLDELPAPLDEPEQRVLRLKAGAVGEHDEELTAGNTRRIGRRLRHRDVALDVDRAAGNPIPNRIARPAGSGTGRIAALDHEARNDPVKRRAVEEPFSHER